ncbi:MAG TPA: isochorismatase family protein, partial [Dehalococcoidia bacterium]|nr:isochorismatase family protein [Dehalococcoidia bacterium]
MAKRIWDDLLTEQDRAVYGSGVFGGAVGIGRTPAIVVVDVLNKSIGDEPLPILEAMKRFGKTCCGDNGWRAIPPIQQVLARARREGVKVVYTIPQEPNQRPSETLQRFDEKMPNWLDYSGARRGFDFADEIAPLSGDIIIRKPTASSFYLTDLEEQLRSAGIDALIVTGCTTSGCVRATVVDAHARGFKINVVEDGVFDRGQTTHAINLFDLQAKYADVIP